MSDIVNDFTHTILGRTGLKVHRLGLSATYRPGKDAIRYAIDSGINYFFFFPIDCQMISVLKDVIRKRREDFIIATGGGNLILTSQNLRKVLDKRLKQLNTDYIDVFHYLGIYKQSQFKRKIEDELLELKQTGKIRFTAISCHERKLIGKLADEGEIDVFMLRYNAAHRGAETDIFPHLKNSNPGTVGYTATRWRFLLRRPKNMPEALKIPTAGQCYRFVLSNPNMHIVLTAPRNKSELEENIRSLEDGTLSVEEMIFMKQFGDIVYQERKWFM